MRASRPHVFPRALHLACALALSGAAVACGSGSPSATDRLRPCTIDEGPIDAYCGRFDVFEDRQAGQGRKIALKIVVLPALSNAPRPDPLFFLAGGPGQGAARMAGAVNGALRRVQATRDVVLVDQRGTGDSNGLECKPDGDTLASLHESDGVGLTRLKACLAGYDADTRFYTTPLAMDDLDDVRRFLGYDRINIYGGSYGTRAGLVYLRQHGDHVRAIVLDGVAPPDMRVPLYFARDTQRALDRLLTDCAANPSCAGKYPRLADRVRALFARLEADPVEVSVTHPRTGASENLRVSADLLAGLVTGALYSPVTSSMVPELLVRAEANDFQGLLALATLSESASENMSTGMQLSVICAEDVPRIHPGDAERETAGTLFARHLLTSQLKPCEFWPAGTVPASYYEPVTSDVPALVLSGEVDPVTPPAWGEKVSAHLSRALHVTAPATGHGVLGTGCGQRLVAAFIERGSVDGLDTSCVTSLKRPPFFLTPAGPDPGATQGTAK